MPDKSDVWQGTLALMILKTLQTIGPLHGYRPRPDEDMQADWNQVMPGFFATIGAPILAGRDFTERDSAGAPHVAIVNETFVRRFCGGTYCVGRRIGFGGGSANLNKEIVGVVKDVRNSSLNEAPRPWTVTPALQNPKPAEMSFYLRTPGRPEALGVAAQNAVRALDPALPVFDMRTVQAEIDSTHFTNRFFSFMSIAFAVLATLLAAIGVYGVTSYAVSRRTQEFGIRVALGADRAEIVRLVAGELGWLSVVGIAIGTGSALAAGRLLSNLLYEMNGNDPAVLAGGALVMIATCLVAVWGPVNRAMRVNPARAVRYE